MYSESLTSIELKCQNARMSTSALFQLGIRVSNISRLGDSPGSYRPTVANAKTANLKFELEQSASRTN